MFISDLSIKRPVFATVMMLALVTLGVASYNRLAIDLYPNVEIPVITVITIYPGASPETVEREVSKRIEEAINPIAGVKHVGSTSREGVSQVVVEFELEVDPDQSIQDARTKIAAIRGELPPGIEDPILEKMDIGGMPIVSLAVRSSTLSPRDLTTLVDKRIKQRIENVTGVGKIDVIGPVTREISVEILPGRLESLGMGVDEVIAGLRAENLDTPLGRMNTAGTETSLRVQARARTVDEFRTMVIATRNGRPIPLQEVATVTDGVEEVRSLAFVDGQRAVALDVLKQSGANAVGVADAVKAEVAALEPDLPPGTSVEVVRDGSIFIREAVADVQETMVIGGLLTIFIVFLFLNSWRSTVITGLTLPISVVSSFIVMNFAGMTLNVMTLMALSLAIGLLIDDAIVVRENIVRHLEHGQDHFEAARKGTSEIGLAVLATSSSILAVFVPVAFMKGIVGRFFFAFGITVAFAVAVSLFVSFTLDPMLSSRWIDPDIARTGKRHLLARVLDTFNAWFDRTADRYRGVIGWALDHRPTVVAIAIAAFVGGLAVLSTLESEFFPPADQGEFIATFRTAPNASIDETQQRLEAVLSDLGGLPEIERLYASIGAGDAGTVRDARIYLKLTDKATRTRSQRDMEREVRARLGRVPGIIPSLALAEAMDSRKLLLVNLRGDEISTLKEYSQRMKDLLYGVAGIVDLEATLEHDTPEYRLIIDRQRAADLGVNTAALTRSVGALIGGQAVTTFEDEDGESRNVRVRLPADLRRDATQVERLRLAVPHPLGSTLVPVASVARYEFSTTPSEINRMDLSREVVVSANLDGLPLGTAVARVTDAASTLGLPPGYRVVISGENEAMEESFRYMAEALILAVIFVYLILSAQFESFVDPLSIMLSLPLSIESMAAMLSLTGDTLNIMSLIGLIMLMGLVTKNAILLVDFAKVLRGRGLDRRAAVIQAGRTRLRPIVMTTAAMIFGMLPLGLGLGAGGEMRAPMARAVIGGLITSTLLTLIVVPVVFTLLDDLGGLIRRRKAKALAVEAAAISLVLAIALGPAVPAFAGAPAPASAGQAPQAPSKVISLEQALAVAAEQNRDIAKAREYRSWVDGKYLEERAAALPHVTFGASLTSQYDDTQSKLFKGYSFGGGDMGSSANIGEIFGGRQGTQVAQVTLTQALFTWGQVGAGMRAAKDGYQFADAQLRQYEHGTARDVAIAYYDVVLAKQLVRISEEDVAQKERHLAETERKLTAGAATDYDLLAARVTAENARPALIRAQNGVGTNKERLRFLLADTTGETFDVVPLPNVTVSPPEEYAQVLATALRDRPELAALDTQRAIYKELVTIARADGKPRVDFSGGVGTRRLGLPSVSSVGTMWSAAFVATVPVFDGMRSRGRVTQAETDLARANIDDLKMRDAVALEVRVAVDAVRDAGELVNALRGTVTQAERLLFLSEKGFELGVKTRLDVQDAEFNVLLARGNFARAERDYRAARAAVDWVAGRKVTGQ